MHSIFTLLALRYRSAALDSSAYHCLIAGWFAGLVALASGALAALPYLGSGQIQLLNIHALVGIVALVIYGQVLQRRRRNPDILQDAPARRTYLMLSACGAGLILVGGWLGGYLSSSAG
jgi:uncharacterized membrane protein